MKYLQIVDDRTGGVLGRAVTRAQASSLQMELDFFDEFTGVEMVDSADLMETKLNAAFIKAEIEHFSRYTYYLSLGDLDIHDSLTTWCAGGEL